MNYCDFLFNVPGCYLDNTALVDIEADRRYSYRKLQKSVKNLAGYFLNAGFKPTDLLMTHLYNSAEAVIAHLAIQYAGCTTCLLDPLVTADGLDYYLKDTGAKCLISHLSEESIRTKAANNLRTMSDFDVLEKSETAESQAAPDLPYNFGPDELAAVFYTSGTTSKPKGVMLPVRSFFAHFEIFNHSCYQYSHMDKLLCFVPFSHGYGSKSIFLPCMHAGATLFMMRSFHPLRVIRAIENEGITHVFGVPSHYQQLLRRSEFIEPLKKLKAAFSAAALLKLETARGWQQKTGYYLDEGYGLIETCTGVAFRKNKMPDRLGNIGTYPAQLVDIEIVDDDFRFLNVNDRGEIIVRGDSVMLGYLNKTDETRHALRDGWFRTGDMGYKTCENEIVLTGRIKDVINVAGIKVAPFEIEAMLNEYPLVQESAVVGVDDEMYGEVVKAFVKISNNSPPDERELVKFLQGKLMNFQIPKEIVFVDGFPRNAMGKVDKNALRSMLG